MATHISRFTSRTVKRATMMLVAATVAVTLSACGAAPWSGNATATPTATRSPGKVTTVVNELANGATKHQLTAGSIGLSVDYFSTLSMDKWTPDANKPLSLSMVANLTNDEGQAVYLSNMSLSVAVYGPDGVLGSPQQLNDRATISPGYLVKNPYSYSQTFVIPPVDSKATYVTFSITYELLLQTTPISAEYAKQTASDTLTVAIAQP